jgi:hypothetical protein
MLFMEANPSTAPTAIFDEAWTFVDQEYSFFEFKNIDWQDVRTQFEPLVSDTMNNEQLFDVLADMLFVLRDGHVNLSASFDRSRNWRWFLNHPPNYDYNLLERNYFNEQQQFVGAFTIFDFGDVGYIRYSSFSNTVTNGAMNYILDKFKDHKGIIIDVRSNGGGNILNVTAIAERFTDQEVLVGRQRYRNGPNYEDFSAWDDLNLQPFEIEEDEEAKRFLKPVVVLTNRLSYSATTMFSQYMRELPNVTLMGDWTGGGGGGPSFTELANGWVLRVSNTQLVAPDGFNVEDGVPPDVRIDLDSTDAANGIDTILEEALELIR